MNSFFTFLFMLVVLTLLIKSGAIFFMKDAFILLMSLIESVLKGTIGIMDGSYDITQGNLY